MTNSPGGRHLDLDVLAEVDEGITGPEVEQAARAHLDGCAECRERMAHLRTTRALLSALPAEPMPAAVQARINAALEQADPPTSGTVVPINRRSRTWNSPAVAGGAAAAAVVVLIGALVAGHVVHRGDKSGSAASTALGGARAPKAANAASTKEWATGVNYTAATIPTLVPRLVTGTPPPNAPASGLDKTVGGLSSNGQSAGGGGSTAGSAGTPEARAAVPSTPVPAPAGVITQEAMRSSRAAVVACGTILAGGVPTVPVAVDFARYAGKPAVIFALPAVGNPAQLDIWVVRSTCSSSSLDVYFRRIPRPTG